MSAKYYVFKNPPKPGEEGTNSYHVRITQRGTIPFRQICKEVANASTISMADSIGTITGLVDILVEHLRDGYTIEIKGLGFFKAVATSQPIEDPEKVRAEHIRFAGVRFRPSQQFTDRMKGMQFVKDPAYRKSVNRPQKERLQMILQYLIENKVIKSSDCMYINGCSRYFAQQDLKLLCDQGTIEAHGYNSSRCYTLIQTETT